MINLKNLWGELKISNKLRFYWKIFMFNDPIEGRRNYMNWSSFPFVCWCCYRSKFICDAIFLRDFQLRVRNFFFASFKWNYRKFLISDLFLVRVGEKWANFEVSAELKKINSSTFLLLLLTNSNRWEKICLIEIQKCNKLF